MDAENDGDKHGNELLRDTYDEKMVRGQLWKYDFIIKTLMKDII